MLTVLAKLGSAETVGLFSLGLAITAPVIMFTNLALHHVQATDARDEYRFGDFLGLRLVTTCLALLIIAAIVGQFGYGTHATLVILAVGVTKAIEAVCDIFCGFFQKHERMDRYGLSRILKGVVSLAALAGTVYVTRSLLWGVASLAVAYTLVLLCFDLPNGRRLIRALPLHPAQRPESVWPRLDPSTLTRLAWLALPLGITGGLISLKTNVPRYFVETHLGLADLGIFAALFYFVFAGKMASDSMALAAIPRLSTYFVEENKAAFSRLLIRLLAFAALMGAIGIAIAGIAGQELLTLLYTREYARQDLFVLLMVVGALGYVTTLLRAAATATRRFMVQLPLLVGVLVSTALASAWLVPKSGLAGAALALLIGEIVAGLGYAVVVLAALRALSPATPAATTATVDQQGIMTGAEA
jgi:O-antigen/teichoic acid export membrane protein